VLPADGAAASDPEAMADWFTTPCSIMRAMGQAVKLEFADRRKLRARNTVQYRFAHWPLWISVFFLANGWMTFRLFTHGFDRDVLTWLAFVMLGTGIAGLFGKLPGVEPEPYIIRFTEDKPNPIYRRICYTLAWSELIAYGSLNLAAIAWALIAGKWRMLQIYHYGFFPLAGCIWLLGAIGALPRVKSSTKGEGDERRYFYGTVWAVVIGQSLLGLLWQVLPRAPWADVVKLLVFAGVLVMVGALSKRGILPRTRKIVPGELAISI
jgi:hypothetical protein